jgi:hypothetical protein
LSTVTEAPMKTAVFSPHTAMAVDAAACFAVALAALVVLLDPRRRAA